MIKAFLLKIIKLYMNIKRTFFKSHMGCCRYYPSCSRYSYQAIEKYGVFKGTFFSIWRILRCNPFSKGGYDPLK